MSFVKAYQAYFQKNYDLCLKLLQECKQNDEKKLDLEAQVYFQKREYQKSYNIYKDLIKRGGEYEQERRDNLLTVIVCAQLDETDTLQSKEKLPSVDDIIEQVKLINFIDSSAHDLSTKLEPNKKKNKHKKRKVRLPKQYDPAVEPDPERWLPRRDRKSNAHKQKKRRQRPNKARGARRP